MAFLIDCQKKIIDLQKRVTETGRNVISRTQRWRRMSTIPATDCDVVVTFGKKSKEEHIEWFINLLHERVPELMSQRQYHRTSGQSALYLSACYRDLLLGAEELGIKKPLAPEHGGGLREFSMDELDLFDNASDELNFLSSGERCWIVHNYLMGLCAREGDVLDDMVFRDGQPLIRPLQSIGLLSHIFPVHQSAELKQLTKDWLHGWTLRQPLDDIRRYFGVQVALYFAWLGHYTFALLFPSVVGLSVWLFVDCKKYKFYDLVMAMLCLLWSTVYLEHWKRTSSLLTYQWGVWDAPPSLLEEPRAAFRGELTKCSITGRMVRTYPAWRRCLTIFFVTAPIIIISLSFVIFITLGFVLLQEQTDAWAAHADAGKFGILILHTPKVLLAIIIMTMDVAYRSLAAWLTELENHRLDAEYHNHLVAKLLLLQFMNCFFSLFYTAFYLQDMDLLQQQLTTLLLTRQILGNIREVFLPYGQSRLRQFFLSFRYETKKRTGQSELADIQYTGPTIETLQGRTESNLDDSTLRRRKSPEASTHSVNRDEPLIPSQEREATLLPYDGPDDDFLEMFIQFGYVSMFSCVFPVAGALAFLNNVVEMRGDAFKLTHGYQRPFPQNATSIGIWQIALASMGYAAVLVNIGLLFVSGAVQELVPKLTDTQTVLLLVTAEHAIFILLYAVSSLISSTPMSVLIQIAKLEHRRREALRTLEREAMRQCQQRRSSSRSNHSESKSVDTLSDNPNNSELSSYQF
ncbi:hypothetical protein T265_06164 [Opisthorchis viverrini]|uniref:Anoctamin n=1 Tax=Opisthorchis viverrini TaxID=6198 RepID=A0A074ZI77_OPIVI|nr:hypothetical protein T265_06164 [Opisthorchis viverrini]KER26666.1 hypothetical protein T265_06164 [Opisthorchis viverrini]